MARTFIREIPIDRLTDAILNDYIARGFEIVWTDNSIEVWAV